MNRHEPSTRQYLIDRYCIWLNSNLFSFRHLVREYKITRNRKELRESEQDKIGCGEKHFAAIGVNYDVVTNLNEALNG